MQEGKQFILTTSIYLLYQVEHVNCVRWVEHYTLLQFRLKLD